MGLRKLVERFAGRYDYLILTKPPNLAYSVGMLDALGLVVDLSTGYSTLYVSRLDYTRAKAVAKVDKVVALASAEIPPRRAGEELVIAPSFLEAIKPLQEKKVASDGKDIGADVSAELLEVRSVKDEEELQVIKEALKITEGVYTRLSEMRLVGLRERDVAALVYKWFLEDGADGVAFDPIVASGPNGAFPHYRYGERRIKHSDLVVVDIGAKKGVYCSDMTRTLGSPTGVLKDAMYAVYEALKAAEKAVREGVPAAEVDKTARDVIKEYGFFPYFIHSTGHGVGVEVHEPPRLYITSRETLQRGNVVTIEPGVYIEGVGGVRIEDMVYVDGGAVVLNKTPRIL